MKIMLIIMTILLGLVVLGGGAFAATPAPGCTSSSQDVLCGGGASSPCNNPNASSLPAICADNNTKGQNPITGSGGILDTITSIILYIVGIVTIIMVVVSGIRMITANGDASAFASARTGLIYALIGMAVALLARAIVLFIVNKI